MACLPDGLFLSRLSRFVKRPWNCSLSTTYFAQKEHIQWPDSETPAIISPLPHMWGRARVRGAQALAAPSPKPSHHTRFPFLDGKGGRSCQRNVPNGLTS